MSVENVPLFVVVDGSTASAAELLAGALKAHKRADLVGQTTFGKNLIQKMVPVSQVPYGAIRLTWAKFYLHETHDLSQKGGITPTIAVEGRTSMGDPDQQLEVAMQRARNLTMR